MKRLVAILMIFLLTICAAHAETEKYTRYTDYTPQKAEPVGLISGDNPSIQTAYTYPSDYDQTVAVGEGQDIDQLEPELAAYLENASGYDTVWLVVPVWHYTICTPLRVFLNETDLSGKTVYVVTTHRGSGFSDVPERVQEMEPEANVVAALAVPGNDAAKHHDEVMEYVNKTIHP